MIEEICALLKDVAADAILPLFRQLGEGDVEEKSPGEVVTAADRRAEELITRELLRRYPDTRVVGEEACAASPSLLEGLDQGKLWLLDPVDGTANFAKGSRPFAVMLARVEEGECVASWMLDPLSGDMCVAQRGGGARVNDVRVRSAQEAPPLASMRGAIFSHFMPEDVRGRVTERLAGVTALPKLMCSGAEYPDVALGDRHVSLFWRTLPWDHAPGALFLQEAGGCVTRLDGTAYRAHDERNGLIVAKNPAVAQAVIAALAVPCSS